MADSFAIRRDRQSNHWQDWGNLILAVWLFLSPWILQFMSRVSEPAGIAPAAMSRVMERLGPRRHYFPGGRLGDIATAALAGMGQSTSRHLGLHCAVGLRFRTGRDAGVGPLGGRRSRLHRGRRNQRGEIAKFQRAA